MIPENYKVTRSPSKRFIDVNERMVFPSLSLTFCQDVFSAYFTLLQDQEQSSTNLRLNLQRSTKWYKQPNTLNSKFTVMQ